MIFCLVTFSLVHKKVVYKKTINELKIEIIFFGMKLIWRLTPKIKFHAINVKNAKK